MAIVRGLMKNSDTETSVSVKKLHTPGQLLEFAEKARIDLIPLDIDELIRKFDIRIVRAPMSDDVSGSLEKKPEGWVISVNSLHHPRRQRFTLAHELGHYVLHGTKYSHFEDEVLFRDSKQSTLETEANRFAASLLMPEEQFREFVRSRSSEVDEIAGHFDVSNMAVRVRAKELGYQGHGL